MNFKSLAESGQKFRAQAALMKDSDPPRYQRDAYRTPELPSAFNRLPVFAWCASAGFQLPEALGFADRGMQAMLARQ
jgi:hypothetical protein